MKPKPEIATVLIESDEQYEYADKQRLDLLLEILKEFASKTQDSGILLFPAGYFHTSHFKPSTKYEKFISPIKEALNKIKNRRIVVVFGVDGRNTSKTSKGFKDQIALAINRSGVIAAARKFHPAPGEEEYVEPATDYLAEENGKSRIFDLNGKRFYLAVCYDVYAIKNYKNPTEALSKPKKKVDAILNCIHGFNPTGPGSGDSYWARKGMAGASRKWRCPVYGSAIFFEGKKIKNWPGGVLCKDKMNESIQDWKYADNKIKKANQFEVPSSKESAIVSFQILK